MLSKLCQKLDQFTGYFSHPISGKANCCIFCLKVNALTLIKLLGLQDFLISIGLILIGINAMFELDIFNLFLKTLSSESLLYGVVFTILGGLIWISQIIYIIAYKKKNLFYLGLIYILVRTIIYIGMTAYSILLLLCIMDSNSSDPMYGFNDETKLQIQDLSDGKFGIFVSLIVYSLFNDYFSFILYLSHKFTSLEFEYEKKIFMEIKAAKQSFAPEWFRNTETDQQRQKELKESKNKMIIITESNEPLKDSKQASVIDSHKGSSIDGKKGSSIDSKSVSQIDNKRNSHTLKIKKSKFNKNQVVPMLTTERNEEHFNEVKVKSSKFHLPDEEDMRKPSQNTMKILYTDERSESSFNDN